MKKQRVRGAKRMQDLGYKQSQIWMTPEQATSISAVADQLGVTRTSFILNAALKAVEKFYERRK